RRERALRSQLRACCWAASLPLTMLPLGNEAVECRRHPHRVRPPHDGGERGAGLVPSDFASVLPPARQLKAYNLRGCGAIEWEQLMESWVERTEVFSGPIFRVFSGQARLADGQTARRDMVAHRGGVGVVPIHEGKVLLVRQFRLAAGREMLEIPAGLLEPGEAPEETAARELAEE